MVHHGKTDCEKEGPSWSTMVKEQGSTMVAGTHKFEFTDKFWRVLLRFKHGITMVHNGITW